MNVCRISLRNKALRVSLLVCAAMLLPGSMARADVGAVVFAWGDNSALQLDFPPGLTNVTAVAAGGSHSLALNKEGFVTGWGFDLFGQAFPPSTLKNVTAIAAGEAHSMALRADGTVVAWGRNSNNQTNTPSSLTGVIRIAAGSSHSLALKSDGTVVGWGDNSLGQSSSPVGLSNVVAIAAGNGFSLALRYDGLPITWGEPALTPPADLAGVLAIAAGQAHCVALKQDGTVVVWGDNSAGQTNVPAGLQDIVAVSAGAKHCVAIKKDGTLVAWGDNTFNQCAVNSSVAGFFTVSAGGYHNLALKGTGAPAITVQPASKSIFTGKTATLQVSAAGQQPLSYQWMRFQTNLDGANASILTLSNIQLDDAGDYTVRVANNLGSVDSIKAVLTVIGGKPFVTVPPVSQNAYCGEGASFSVTVDGSGPFTYQWLFNNGPIADATSSTLVLDTVTPANSGPYSVGVYGPYGAITSSPPVTLTVVVEPPLITSPLVASAKQGAPFTYTITGLHRPTSFKADKLPYGLSLDTATGVISGSPQGNGIYGVDIEAINSCASAKDTLVLTVAPSLPEITSSLTAASTEGAAFSYQITATESPTGFAAKNLPAGLVLDPVTGIIAGQPAYAGVFDSTISATNAWGAGSATLRFTIASRSISALSVANVTYNYSSPYLLDFQFSLRDDPDPASGKAVVADPQELSVKCKEDDVQISDTETAHMVRRGNTKQLKAFVVLDFTESVASLSNGDTNNNGISDAADTMMSSAINFVNQQPTTALLGAYEFHRDDVVPARVSSLTTDKAKLNAAIAGIWTNYVKNFPAGSRCWDAAKAAIGDMGPTNRDEQRYVILVSDGRDESSTASLTNLINTATNAQVNVYAIGFGSELDPVPLQILTSATSGRYYSAQTPDELADAFSQIGKDLNGQFILRWATLKRTGKAFMPSFEVTYQGQTALSPLNPVFDDTNNPIIDTNATPPTTNFPLVTNIIIAPYVPTKYAGPVTVGTMRLVPNAEVQPTGITLRATYIPRYVRQIRLHYRANWPVEAVLQSTGANDLFSAWSMTTTNDGLGGEWVLLSSPNTNDFNTSLLFAGFGPVLNFNFRDPISTTNAFSVMEFDNSIYTNTGGQSFVIDATNLTAFVTVLTNLPYGTPIPWLTARGFSGNFAAAEVSDPDNDGVLTWQEYRAGTEPKNANSKLIVRSVVQGADGRNLVTFSSALNRLYSVESSEDLFTWDTVQQDIVGTGADITEIDTRFLPGITTLFYRVLVY